jgi:hypothetical protein
MDSIKLIEETSFQEKNMKNLRKIEKDNDFLYSSGHMNHDRNKRHTFNQSQSSTSNPNFIKNFKNKLDKDLRSSSDKFNDLIYNLYPENSFKFQKSNYKKYINGGVNSSSTNNASANYKEAGEASNFNNMDINEEKIKSLLIKKKNK